MRHLSVPEELNASLLEQLIFLLILYHLDMIRTLGETLAMRVVKDAYAALVEKRLARKF